VPFDKIWNQSFFLNLTPSVSGGRRAGTLHAREDDGSHAYDETA
jgi:hypothetical protein